MLRRRVYTLDEDFPHYLEELTICDTVKPFKAPFTAIYHTQIGNHWEVKVNEDIFILPFNMYHFGLPTPIGLHLVYYYYQNKYNLFDIEEYTILKPLL